MENNCLWLIKLFLLVVCSTLKSEAQDNVAKNDVNINLNPNDSNKVRILNGVEMKPSVYITQFERIIQNKDTLIIENEYSILYDKILKKVLRDPFFRDHHKDEKRLPIVMNKRLLDHKTEVEISIEFKDSNIISVKYIIAKDALKNGYKNLPFGYFELNYLQL